MLMLLYEEGGLLCVGDEALEVAELASDCELISTVQFPNHFKQSELLTWGMVAQEI